MSQLVKEILTRINFAEKYQEVCNKFSNLENGLTFKRLDVKKVLALCNINLCYAVNEKCFYMDYSFKDSNLRFTMSFKHGYVECFYAIWNKNDSDRVVGRFNTFATLQNPQFNDITKHKFPIATSKEELQDIIGEIWDLHNNFLTAFEYATTSAMYSRTQPNH